MSERVQHGSAWGDDDLEEQVPEPVSEPVARISGFAGIVKVPEATTELGEVEVYHDPPEILSGQLSHALVLAFQEEKPKVGGWQALAKRLGIHSSLLQRLRSGVGNVSSVDEVAAKLGWQIIIRRPR